MPSRTARKLPSAQSYLLSIEFFSAGTREVVAPFVERM
jgi:hypothetical protein